MLFREGEDVFFFDEERLVGLDGEGRGSGFDHALNRGFADGRDVEAVVLLGLRDFDDDGAAVRELAAARDAGVRAFDGFECHDGHVLDDDGLADVEAAEFLRDAEAELHVFHLLFRRGELGERAAMRHEHAQECRLVKGLHARFRELVDEHHHDGVVFAVGQRHDELHHARVGRDFAVEEQFFRDFAEHRDFFDAFFLQIVQDGIDVADADVDALGRAVFEVLRRFIEQAHGVDFEAEALRCFRTFDGQMARTCEQSDSFHEGSSLVNRYVFLCRCRAPRRGGSAGSARSRRTNRLPAR